ncbi:MAG: hypothetical protein JSV85_04880 [Candidatus Bathyarchaeota archaeon]|nr:MAG: hypothetical protein JSV85_04880 [Candidatus Bathyarchaeota archaeon]
MFVHEIFRVLYSPFKAFKEIVKNPDVKGPILILLITVVATAGEQYISASKTFFENPTPDLDSWTESTLLWSPNNTLSCDTDRIVGNCSVKSLVSNDTSIWMKKKIPTDLWPLVCSGDSGYTSFSFRIKWIHSVATLPSDATLRLFSGDESNYFEFDLKDRISDSSDKWSSVNVSIGPQSQGWTNQANWENITALEYRLSWSNAANITIKIDDLYFGKYVSSYITDVFTGWLVGSLMGSTTDFLIRWILFAGLLLLIIKIFGGETGPWSALFNVVGYVFAVMMVYIVIDTLLISMLPPLSFPFRAWSPVAGEEEIGIMLLSQIIDSSWGTTLAYNIRYYLPFAVHVWIVALGTTAVHFAREFSWEKAAAISAMSYIMLILLKAVIPI